MKCDLSLYNLRGGAALAWAQSPTLSLVSQLHAKIVTTTLAIDSILLIIYTLYTFIYSIHNFEIYLGATDFD